VKDGKAGVEWETTIRTTKSSAKWDQTRPRICCGLYRLDYLSRTENADCNPLKRNEERDTF
jgi:hypothetical protein